MGSSWAFVGAIAAALAGCGRFGFDPHAPGDAAADSAIDVGPDATIQPIAFVQAIGASANTGTTSLDAVLPMPVHAGNVVILAVDWFSAANISAATDTLGTTYTIVVPAFSAGVGTQSILVGVVPQDGMLDVTVSFDASTQLELRVHELAGLATTNTFDTGGQLAGFVNSPGTALGPALTTSQPNELVFGFEIASTATAGPGYTTALLYDNDVTEYAIAPTPMTYMPSAVITQAPNSWQIQGAVFRGQ